MTGYGLRYATNVLDTGIRQYVKVVAAQQTSVRTAGKMETAPEGVVSTQPEPRHHHSAQPEGK